MEKVLVTGAYGFLGRYVVKELVECGYHVIAFGRDPQKLATLKEDHVDLFVGDFCNEEEIVRAAEGVDYVIHCGALLKGWGRREDFIRANVDGTRNVLTACEKNHVKRLVYTSSPSAYAKKDNLNITEADYNEKNHLNHYIESKIIAEKLVRSQDKVPFAMIRPRGLCGIGDQNMLPVLINANSQIGIPLFEKGNVIVDMCCIENVALSLRLCMEKDEALRQVYNITNGEPQKLTQLVDGLFEKLGLTPKYVRMPFGLMYGIAAVLEFFYKLFGIYDKAPVITRYNICTLGRSQVFDITKAKEELGYAPKVSLSEMMETYAAYYHAEQNKQG